MADAHDSPGIGRREFLRRGAAAGLGLSLGSLPGAWAASEDGPARVRRRVPLGRTGLEMPDIGFGSSRLAGDEQLQLHQQVGRGMGQGRQRARNDQGHNSQPGSQDQ